VQIPIMVEPLDIRRIHFPREGLHTRALRCRHRPGLWDPDLVPEYVYLLIGDVRTFSSGWRSVGYFVVDWLDVDPYESPDDLVGVVSPKARVIGVFRRGEG
jgi:hypothetical protein